VQAVVVEYVLMASVVELIVEVEDAVAVYDVGPSVDVANAGESCFVV